MRQETAETIAAEALAWLAGRDDLLEVFMGATDAGVEDFRARAADPDFLGSVLDFVTMDDAWIADLCAATGRPPEAPLAARHALPGGAPVHWT